MNLTPDCFSSQTLQNSCDLTNQSWRPKSADWQDAGHIVYTVFLFFFLTLGSIGNVLSILVLSHPSHRNNILSPLMINLAVAGILVTVFGYPMSFSRLVTGTTLQLGQFQCTAYGFVNGTVGMASIATFTEMSLVMNYCMHQMSPRLRVSAKFTLYLISGAWIYGVMCMLPPLLGWTQFAPSNAAVSCGPDWTDVSRSGMAYSLILVVVGFVIPLFAISVSHFKMYRLLRQDFLPGNNHVRRRRRKSQVKLVRVTATTIVIFMLSWSPYCFVSIASVFKGGHAISAGEAEVPELMAKASYVYNPIVYMVMSKPFRRTLRKILTNLCCRWCVSKDGDKESQSGSKTQNYVTEVV